MYLLIRRNFRKNCRVRKKNMYDFLLMFTLDLRKLHKSTEIYRNYYNAFLKNT